MDIRVLNDVYAVAPQISPEDMPALADAGYRTIICNRPDPEVVPDVQSSVMRRAAESAGMTFVYNPVPQEAISAHEIGLQVEAIRDAPGPSLAYCASGTRSAVVWMFGAVRSTPTGQVIAAVESAGYPLGWLRPQLESLEAAAKRQ